MHRLFSKMVDAHKPKYNEAIVNGLAVLYMAKAEEYIDRVFRSASRSFPEGLTYDGYTRCTPKEEYAEFTKVRNNTRSFDLAESSIYMVKYFFSWQGTQLSPRYIYLPYVGDGGLMHMSGTLYHINPVLSDKVISPGVDSIFVRLVRDKTMFRRLLHSMTINGVRETHYVIWSRIYRNPGNGRKVPATTNATTSVAHYLFARMGFTKVFQKYVGTVPIVGKDLKIKDYPSDKWVFCESSRIQPKTYMGGNYKPNDIKMAIPIEYWNSTTKALVIGFYYVIDHFPERWSPEWLDNRTLWMVLLGHIIFSGVYGDNKLYSNMEEHFASLDDYADPMVIEKLKENDYHIEDFYDLLALIMGNFSKFMHTPDNSKTSMFGKNLEVLYFALYDITSSIFIVNFRLSKLAKKRPLTMNNIIETFNKNLTQGKIHKLNNGRIVCEAVSYSGDNKYPKLTSRITEQESSVGTKRGKNQRLVVTENEHLDVSMVEAGSILFLSKSNPSPVARINPYVKVDLRTGTVIPDPRFKELRDEVAKLLGGRTHIEGFDEELAEVGRDDISDRPDSD